MNTFSEIQVAVRERVVAAAGTTIPVKYYHKRFDHADKPYAELIISPNTTALETQDGGDMMQGFLLFNIHVKNDQGTEHPATLAQPFLDLFPRDLEIDINGNQVLPVTGNNLRITHTGTIRGAVDSDDPQRKNWKMTPVLIPYEMRACSK